MLRQACAVICMLSLVMTFPVGAEGVHDGAGDMQRARTFRYLTYDEMVAGMNDLEGRHPGLVRVTTAQQEFGIPDQQGYRTWIIRLTNETSGLDKPEVFVSGALHGNEKVGPIAAYEYAVWLADNYNTSAWARRMLDSREIYIIPMTNAWGWANAQRTDENGLDPNRDFPYDQSTVLQSIPARAVDEMYKHHLFIAAVTFHAGMRVIGYEWGSYSHNTPPYESPDDRAQDQLARYMRTYAGPYDGYYPYGRMNEKVYPVHGGMEDWGYASSWDTKWVTQGYSYPNDSNRAFTVLVETSSNKAPPESSLGTDEDIPTPGGKGDGHVPKNMRLLMVLTDSVMPYVDILTPPPPQAATGSTVGFEWQVGGAFTVDETQILWGDDPDPINNSKYSTPVRSGLSRWDNYVFSENITMPSTPGDYYFVVRAKVDQDMLKQSNPDPNIPPQSHFVQIRTNDSWSPSNNGNTLHGHTHWYSRTMRIHVNASSVPPVVTSTSPRDGETNVSLNAKVSVSFSKPMDQQSVEAAFSITPQASGNFSWSAGMDTFSYTPGSLLAPGTQYTVTVSSSAKDSSGIPMQGDHTFTFTTGSSSDTIPPAVTGTRPKDGESSVPISTNIEVTFSERMNRPSAESAFSIQPDAPGTFSWNSDTLVLDPLSDLAESTAYNVTVSTFASDISGNPLASPYSFTFTTGVGDLTPPDILSTSPPDGAVGVGVSADIVITFSEPVDQVSAEPLFIISPGVPGRLTWSGASIMVYTHPYDAFMFNTEYTVRLAAGTKDLAGNAMTVEHTFTFRTVESAPTVVSTTPADGSTGVPLGTLVSVTFDRPMDTSSVEGAFVVSPRTGGGSFTWDAGNTTLTFHPAETLLPDTKYVVMLSNGARDTAGVNLTEWFAFSFTTVQEGGGPGPDAPDPFLTAVLLVAVGAALGVALLAVALRRRGRGAPTYPSPPYTWQGQQAYPAHAQQYPPGYQDPPPPRG